MDVKKITSIHHWLQQHSGRGQEDNAFLCSMHRGPYQHHTLHEAKHDPKGAATQSAFGKPQHWQKLCCPPSHLAAAEVCNAVLLRNCTILGCDTKTLLALHNAKDGTLLAHCSHNMTYCGLLAITMSETYKILTSKKIDPLLLSIPKEPTELLKQITILVSSKR